MSFFEHADRRSLTPETIAVLEQHAQISGVPANDLKILACNEDLVRAYVGLVLAGLYSGDLRQSQRMLVATAASGVAQSPYCEAHMAAGLQRAGASAATIQYALGLRGDDGMNPVDIAIVEFGWAAGSTPSRVTKSNFDRVREHFSDGEVVELAFAAALVGLLHRVNALLGTSLENDVYSTADQLLGDLAWDAGVHRDEDRIPAVRPPHPWLQRPVSRNDVTSRVGRLDPLAREKVPELGSVFAEFDRRGGGVPNSMLTMARRPELVKALARFLFELTRTRQFPQDLAFMCSWVASYASGCQHCQAHASMHAYNSGASAEKVEALWSYATSPLFSASERAALDLALGAASFPASVSPKIVDAASEHFTTRELIDLTYQIGAYGFLNRWNDTFATTLDETSFEFAAAHLGDAGWTGDKHAPAPADT